MSQFDRLLSIFDLKDKKAGVYLAVLELGSSTVTPIARQAGVIRTTTYDILEDLQIRGLIIFKEQNGRRYYQASDPRRLKQILLQQQKEVDRTLPELLALYKPSKEKPVVRSYDGPDEIAKIYEAFWSANSMYGYSNFEKVEQYFPGFYKYARKQLKRSAVICDITLRTPRSEQYTRLYEPPKHQLRFFPASMNFETDNVVFDDKVAIFSYGDTIHGLIIESASIAKTQKMVFDQLWAISEAL